MKNALQIERQREADLKFIISAVTEELSGYVYLEYFNTWEGMGGMQWFFYECVDLAEEVMLSEGSEYLRWLDYYATTEDDRVKGFDEFTNTACFDWYHMNKARELFESRYEKDDLKDNLTHIGEHIGCIIHKLGAKDRGTILEIAKAKADELVEEKLKDKQVEDAINYLKELDLDGESTQAILEGIGMDEQMHSQLNVKFNNR